MKNSKSILICLFLMTTWFMAAMTVPAQDTARQAGAILWDDFEEGLISWTADRAATDIGSLPGEGVNGSMGRVIDLNADSDGFWAARMQTTFTALENASATAWRFQFAAKVNKAPTAVSARLARAAEPYTSTEDIMPNLEIPAGSEGKFFFFDFLIPFVPFLDTTNILLLFGIIGEMDTEVVLDDVYLYPWNTAAMLTFENSDPTAVAEAIGGTLELETKTQKEGVYSAKLTAADGGSARKDTELIALWTPYPDPYPRPEIGNYRVTVQAKSNVVPLHVQAGVEDRTAGSRFLSPTDQVITQKDTWQELSFLVKMSTNDAEQYGFFFDTGGQGAHIVTYDMVIVKPTTEVITGMEFWPLY